MAKTFDQLDVVTKTAVSDKTLNTLSVSYVRDPRQIYWQLKQYVDATDNYKPRAKIDADLEKIESKVIQLAIPEYTSPTQWRYLFSALA
jgi:filamentous hemagglutinin